MVLVAGIDSGDGEALGVDGFVGAVLIEEVLSHDELAPLGMGHLVVAHVVGVVVSVQNQVGGEVVAVASEGVDVHDGAVVAGQAKASVSLV